jgi:hypothetical protein
MSAGQCEWQKTLFFEIREYKRWGQSSANSSQRVYSLFCGKIGKFADSSLKRTIIAKLTPLGKFSKGPPEGSANAVDAAWPFLGSSAVSTKRSTGEVSGPPFLAKSYS